MSSRGEKRKIVDVDVFDVEKRREPSKHYVYIIRVTWSDKIVNIIYRRYSRFFDFQHSLLEKFPIASGQIDPKQRIIPFLPGKIYLGRSHVRDVALKRLSQINEYCQTLIHLDEEISQCEEVIDFFDLEEDDVNPPKSEKKKKANIEAVSKISQPRLGEQYRVIADYQKEDKWDLNLKAGTEVEVVEKSESGWWFVNVQDQQGWVPSTYLKRKDGAKESTSQKARPGEEESYICTETYIPSNSDEVRLDKGCLVEVVEKNLDGWWWIRYQSNEGWAPATYLMKAEKAHMERVARASGVQVVGGLSDISDLMNENGDDSWDDEPAPPPRPTAPYVLKKSRSIERGGSIRPPPRQNSIKNIKLDAVPAKAVRKQYVTIADFEDTVGDGISFSKGQIAEVKEKTDDGWWFVKIGNTEGWAPSTYLESREMEEIEEDDDFDFDYEPNYSEVADESDSDLDIPSENNNTMKDNEYEEVDYEVPLNIVQEGEKPKFVLAETKTERHVNSESSLTEKRTKRQQNPAIKRPTARPPPPPVAITESSKTPPSIDRSSLAAALKSKLENKHSGESPKKSDLEEKLSKTSSRSDQKPLLPPKLPIKPEECGKKSPKLPIKPEESGRRSPRQFFPKETGTNVPRDRINSEEPSLADILKSKFESRHAGTIDSNSDNSTFNTFPKKTVSNVTKTMSNQEGDDSCKSLPVPKHNKPALPPKFDKPCSHSKIEIKNDGPQKRLSMQEEGSELANALKARLENRKQSEQSASYNYSAVEKPKKTFPKKPMLPSKFGDDEKESKPVIPPKIDIKNNTESEAKHSELKTKFEGGVLSRGGWKKESCKPSNKPPVLDKPKKWGTTVNTKTMESSQENKTTAEETLPKAGFAKELAARLVSNPSTKQDTNLSSKPAIPKKSNAVQKSDNLKNSNTAITPTKALVVSKTFRSIAEYKSGGPGEISFDEGVEMEVMDKTDGWWLVKIGQEEGWAPATFIEQSDASGRPTTPVCDSGFTSPEEGSNSSVKYKTVSDFSPEGGSELGFKEGWVVEVLDASEDDWWYVRIDGKEGWVPADYLEEV